MVQKTITHSEWPSDSMKKLDLKVYKGVTWKPITQLANWK